MDIENLLSLHPNAMWHNLFEAIPSESDDTLCSFFSKYFSRRRDYCFKSCSPKCFELLVLHHHTRCVQLFCENNIVSENLSFLALNKGYLDIYAILYLYEKDSVRLDKLPSSQKFQSLSYHKNAVQSLALNEDYIVSGCYEGKVNVFAIKDEFSRVFSIDICSFITKVKITSRYAFAATHSGILYVVDLQLMKCFNHYIADQQLTSLEIGHEIDTLYIGRDDGVFTVYNFITKSVVFELEIATNCPSYNKKLTDIVVNRNNTFVSAQNGKIFVLSLEYCIESILERCDNTNESYPICLAISKDERLLLSGENRSLVILWEIATGDIVHIFDIKYNAIHGLQFYDNDRKMIYIPGFGGKVVVHSLMDDFKMLKTFDAVKSGANCMIISGDETFLACAGRGLCEIEFFQILDMKKVYLDKIKEHFDILLAVFLKQAKELNGHVIESLLATNVFSVTSEEIQELISNGIILSEEENNIWSHQISFHLRL
eukprot:TRINITY_DN3008_c1_g1_i1.p1 TRINITY_DN3008_c1_g1~~TRINITY_DN3008_c1_g1_i1.p1  ORF type:complete len:486 (+),score=98.17 TRINITY_DN3008_c1_g1_i1:170-1627(+)